MNNCLSLKTCLNKELSKKILNFKRNKNSQKHSVSKHNAKLISHKKSKSKNHTNRFIDCFK